MSTFALTFVEMLVFSLSDTVTIYMGDSGMRSQLNNPLSQFVNQMFHASLYTPYFNCAFNAFLV